MRVRKPEVAEDVVQETLLAAFRNHKGFSSHSSERTWLCGARTALRECLEINWFERNSGGKP
jgi:DNA-directed RNA polymerase specialized sigma24 family protein